jgi:hypothetical protein
MSSNVNPASSQPLASLDEWEDFLKDKYPEPAPAPARKAPAVGTAPALARPTLPTVSPFFRPVLLNSVPVKLTVLP